MVIFEGLKQQFLERKLVFHQMKLFKADKRHSIGLHFFSESSLYNSLKSVVGGFLS